MSDEVSMALAVAVVMTMVVMTAMSLVSGLWFSTARSYAGI
jgi:hypothetical protein